MNLTSKAHRVYLKIPIAKVYKKANRLSIDWLKFSHFRIVTHVSYLRTD
jgi:hypothetical protein